MGSTSKLPAAQTASGPAVVRSGSPKARNRHTHPAMHPHRDSSHPNTSNRTVRPAARRCIPKRIPILFNLRQRVTKPVSVAARWDASSA